MLNVVCSSQEEGGNKAGSSVSLDNAETCTTNRKSAEQSLTRSAKKAGDTMVEL